MNFNQVVLIGRVTRDIEKKQTQSGTSVVNFSIATNSYYTDKAGKKQEETSFHNIVAWGKTADLVAEYVVKGQELMVLGKLQTRSWEKDGEKRYVTEVVAQTINFGSKPNNNKSSEKFSDNLEDPLDFHQEEINPSDLPF